jgi:hypothetical protein
MTDYGQVIGLPFAIEGIAFFIEAIFLGIYLYGWDRLPARTHLLSGIPIIVAGVASAFFVVSANAWMNTPTGYTVTEGRQSRTGHPVRLLCRRRHLRGPHRDYRRRTPTHDQIHAYSRRAPTGRRRLLHRRMTNTASPTAKTADR